MKNLSPVRTMALRWMTSLALGMGLILLPAADAADAASPSWLLEKGIYAEETKGDLKGAVAIYRQIVEDPRAARGLVAQAQLRLGLCQLKLGNKPQAIHALDRLTQEFPDKDQLLQIVEQQMPQVLDEIVQQIERNYLQEVDRGELIETAIRAIVGKLDARGGFLRTNDLEFLGAREMKQIDEQLDQKLAGIGAALKLDGGEVVVRSLFPGSPALKGGLRAGDRITGINGVELQEGPRLETAVKLLRGPAGTPVLVRVQRGDASAVQEIELVRDIIRLPSVHGARRKADHTWDFMLEESPGTGYLRLTQVGRQSAEEMRAALGEMQARGMKSLILDLRQNPGGLLDGAVAIADLFLESGRIVTFKGRDGERALDAVAPGTYSGFPIALLVNRETASAAEIIAASLQDHQRGVVIGERTQGEGIVRGFFQLKSGVGAMKLPIAAYYRPSGKFMHRYPDSKDSDDWGVRPDPGCELALAEVELKGLLEQRASREALLVLAPPAKDLPDRQLEKALAWLRLRLEAGSPAEPVLN